MNTIRDTRLIDEAAAELHQASISREPISPLTESMPGFDIDDAYRVQRLLNGRRIALGAVPVGWKIGLTSRAMQQVLGVDAPDFGRLLDVMRRADQQPVSMSELLQPKVEPEIAFVLKSGLAGPGVTIDDVLAATDVVVPALEIIDSRITDWRIRLEDTVADNASCGLFVLGPTPRSPQGLDLATLSMTFSGTGLEPVTATGAAVLGHPARAVAWLANTLARFDERFEPGEIILSGSLVGAEPARPGSHFEANFDHLGRVACLFTGETS